MRPDGKQIRLYSVPVDRMVKYYGACEIASDVAITTTALATIGALQLSLPSAGTYFFQFTLGITYNNTLGGTVGVGVDFSGAVTRLRLNVMMGRSATNVTMGSTELDDTAINDSGTRLSGGPFPAELRGSITVPGAGVLSCRARRTVGTCTIESGSAGFACQL